MRNVTFEDIFILSSQAPGSIVGLQESCFRGLSFRNVTFGTIENTSKWVCKDVDTKSFVHVDVDPPFGECEYTPGNGTCAHE